MSKTIWSHRLLLACIVTTTIAATSVAKVDKRRLPSIDTVETIIEHFFDNERDYRPGEIISRSQVRRLFVELDRAGWEVPKQDDIANRVPDDSEMLVRELRTKAGRKFARQIDRYPLAYDKLDRLLHMPTGKSAFMRLIKGPDGYKLLEYMDTAPGGNVMGQMLSNTPTGKNFNKPTGRIYVPSSLIEVLRHKYEETWQTVYRSQVKALQLRDSAR